MLKSTRLLVVSSLAGLGLALAGTGIQNADAQSKKKSSSRSVKKKESDKPSGRLPRYYGQLELKEEQRNAIYSIQETDREDIDDLQKQLATLRKEMNDEIEDILTTTQKRTLSSLQKGGGAKGKSKSKSSSTKKESSDDD